MLIWDLGHPHSSPGYAIYSPFNKQLLKAHYMPGSASSPVDLKFKDTYSTSRIDQMLPLKSIFEECTTLQELGYWPRPQAILGENFLNHDNIEQLRDSTG